MVLETTEQLEETLSRIFCSEDDEFFARKEAFAKKLEENKYDKGIKQSFYKPHIISQNLHQKIRTAMKHLTEVLVRAAYENSFEDYPSSDLVNAIRAITDKKPAKKIIPFSMRVDCLPFQDGLKIIEINAVQYGAYGDAAILSKSLEQANPELNEQLCYISPVQSHIDHFKKFGKNFVLLYSNRELDAEDKYLIAECKEQGLNPVVIKEREIEEYLHFKDGKLCLRTNGRIPVDFVFFKCISTLGSITQRADFLEELLNSQTLMYDSPVHNAFEDRNLLALFGNYDFIKNYSPDYNGNGTLRGMLLPLDKIADAAHKVRKNPGLYVVKVNNVHAGKGVFVGEEITKNLDELKKKDSLVQERIPPAVTEVNPINGEKENAIYDISVYVIGTYNPGTKAIWSDVGGYLSRYQPLSSGSQKTNIHQNGGMIPVMIARK
ncbi:MAG TPA: hypothetical protein VI894_02665 [Candidatus Nanoarchaeia archaeon]|nr:hypothetical protein [Candidatus Nanoarchaeia archaeon]